MVTLKNGGKGNQKHVYEVLKIYLDLSHGLGTLGTDVFKRETILAFAGIIY